MHVAAASLPLGYSGSMKNLISLTLILLLAGAAFTQVNTAPTVIFGITLGRPLPEFPKCRKQFAEEPPCKFVIDSKLVGLKVYESKSELVLPQMIDGNVESIMAKWQGTDVCRMAHSQLEVKFGKPSSAIPSTLITRAGIKVERITTIWNPSDSTATLMEPADQIDNCLFAISTSKWIDAHPPEKVQF